MRNRIAGLLRHEERSEAVVDETEEAPRALAADPMKVVAVVALIGVAVLLAARALFGRRD